MTRVTRNDVAATATVIIWITVVAVLGMVIGMLAGEIVNAIWNAIEGGGAP